MLSKLFVGLCLMALSVVIHAAGLAAVIQRLPGRGSSVRPRWRSTWQLITIAGWMILLHLAEICVWALFYLWTGAIADLASALYFSAVTYTTTGYGDVVLPETWRLIGAVEALTGILMCGLSTGFFFAVVSRIYETTAARTQP